MASLDSVMQKLYRATHHYHELNRELIAYYSKQETVQMRLAGKGLEIRNLEPVPARFGLIAGDALQCLRSALDYLVWELVLANGQTPTQQNAFPICLWVKDYKNEIDRRNRLYGVHPSACALIDALQPLNFPESEREQSPLALLDKLTNINKHRRVILTNLKREVLEDQPLPFPHILSGLNAILPRGNRHTIVTFAFYVAIDEGIISGKEIGTVLDVFGNYIVKELLPPFQQFFKVT